MMTEVACFMCQGTGRTWDDKPCPECGGRGWIEEDVDIELRIRGLE